MIKEETAIGAWKEAINTIRSQGSRIKAKSAREYLEAQNLIVTLARPPGDINRIINTLHSNLPVLYPSQENLKSFILSKHQIPGFKYSYGRRIFSYGSKGINQIEQFIIPLLKDNLLSKRTTITLWDPAIDSKPYKIDTPSLVLLETKVRDGRLHLTAITRSLDFYLGWPAHLYQLLILQEYLRDRLKEEDIIVRNGSITTISLNALLFTDLDEQMRTLLDRITVAKQDQRSRTDR